MVRRRSSTLAFALLALILNEGRALAGGIYFPYLGARATGMGTAFVARADDATSLFHNPAGMILVRGDELTANLHLNFPNFEYTRHDGGVIFETEQLEKAFNPQPFVGFVSHRQNQPYAFGAGIYAAWGGLPDWPDRGAQRYQIDYLHLVIVHTTLGGAYKLTDSLSIGAGGSLIYASLGQRKSVDARDLLGLDERITPGVDDPDNEIIATVDTQDWAFGANVGLLYRPSKAFHIGATYTLPTTIGYEGTIESDVSNVRLLSLLIGDTIDAKTQVEFTLCQVLRGGIAVRPARGLSLNADVTWQGWSAVKENRLSIDEQPLLEALVGEIILPRNWEDSLSFAVGAEYELGNGHAIRAGYFYDQGAIPTSTVLVDDPDADKSAITGGGTIRVAKGLLMDLSAEYRKYSDITVTDSVYDYATHPEPNYIGGTNNGFYQSSIVSFSAGVRYRLPSNN